MTFFQVQLFQRDEGQLNHMAEPVTSGHFSLTPSQYSSLPHCGRTGRDGQVWLNKRGHRLCTTFSAVWGQESRSMPQSPCDELLDSPGELPPARRVTHRQTTYYVRKRWYGVAIVLLPPATISYGWLSITALLWRITRRLLLGGGGGGATLLCTEFLARNHSALEYIDFVIGHGRSGVPLSSTRLRQHVLTPTWREYQSGKRTLETPCHTKIATGPQDTTDHTSGPVLSNVVWDTSFPR